MEMVVLKGFGNASISEIARNAGVAEGYLYNFYKGKADLVESLLSVAINEISDKLESLLNENFSLPDIFEQLIRQFFAMANEQPEKIKFLYVLMNDYNFKVQESQRQRIVGLCMQAKDKGIASGEIREDIDEEEIYLIAVTNPIQFINLRFKNFFNKSTLGNAEMEKIIRICNNSIKK